MLSPAQKTSGYSLKKVKQNASGLGDMRQSLGLELNITALNECLYSEY